MGSRLQAADVIVVALYFMLVLSIGFLAMWKTKRSTVGGYFLAGRSMNWVVIGASLFVSNIGSEHFIGLAGSGAASGYAVGAWEFNALLVLQLLGWVFIPVYIHSGVYTMPEYLSKRYGGTRLKVYFAALSLLLYIFTKLSVDLYSGALFIQQSLGWNLYLSVLLLICVTALLTVTGGLVAVIYTDTLQALLMIAGALCLTFISLMEVGGLEGVRTKYMQATPNVTAILAAANYSFTYSNSCHIQPKPQALKVVRGPLDPDIPWPGFLLGQTPASIWYWCADQVIVQRVLATKNTAHAKGATLMAGFLKALPMFLMVIPGMVARVLFVDDLACIGPEHCMAVCSSRAGCSNMAYPRLVMHVMPTGLRGLMMAVMIAALMSDLDSIFNSASTIFTLDVYKMLRNHASPQELMVVGRLFVVFMVAISIAWVPVIVEMQGGQMYLYIQEVADYLTPPVAALFLLGVLWKRCNESGAFWGGVTGFILGSIRLVLAFVYREPLCDQPDTRPFFIRRVHYMYVAAMLFWVSGLVAVVVSLCTPPPSEEQVRRATLWGLWRRDRKQLDRLEDKSSGYCNNTKGHNEAPSDAGKKEGAEQADMILLVTPSGQPGQQGNGHVPPLCQEEQSSQQEGGKCLRALDWFCGYKVRGAPLTAPEEQGAPPTGPEERGGPLTAPEERGAPPTGPEERGAPLTAPEERGAPPTGPEERGGPLTAPEERGAPPTGPEEWGAPLTAPEERGAPPTGPEERGGPLTAPEEQGAPPTGPEAAPSSPEDERRLIMQMLHEPPKIQLLLNLGLLLVCCLGIFMFVYFSL